MLLDKYKLNGMLKIHYVGSFVVILLLILVLIFNKNNGENRKVSV